MSEAMFVLQPEISRSNAGFARIIFAKTKPLEVPAGFALPPFLIAWGQTAEEATRRAQFLIGLLEITVPKLGAKLHEALGVSETHVAD
jgi:hypothetical protein